jgi:hypothetical protein
MKTFNAKEARQWMVKHPLEILQDSEGNKRRWNPYQTCFEAAPNFGSDTSWVKMSCHVEQTYTLSEPEPKPKVITTIEEALACEELMVSNRFSTRKYFYAKDPAWNSREILEIKLYLADPDFTVMDGENE